MKISVEVIKNVLDQFSNTVFPDDQTLVTIPVLGDFNNTDYNDEVKVTKFYFKKDVELWFLISID
jgi:hypothetical protein